MNNKKQQTEKYNLNKLVDKLKTEDKTYARLIKAVQIMYWLLIPVLAVLTLRDYAESKDIYGLAGGLCFILAFLIFALFFKSYYKKYVNVDYSIPTVQMLKKAAWRYKPFQRRMLWIMLAILLVDAGLTFSQINYTSIWNIQLVYLGIVTFSLVIGLIIWHIKYKPLRNEALTLIKEIEGN